MNVPVKTIVMQKIGEALATITNFNSVNRWRNIPVDLDNFMLPCLFFYELRETPTLRNRLLMNELHLILEIYNNVPAHGYEDFTDELDILQAEVHNALFSTINKDIIKGLVLECSQGVIKKEQYNDTTSILRMEMFVSYGHTVGNAYSHSNY
jgi:hypothetical protein